MGTSVLGSKDSKSDSIARLGLDSRHAVLGVDLDSDLYTGLGRTIHGKYKFQYNFGAEDKSKLHLGDMEKVLHARTQ